MIKGHCHTNLDDAKHEKWPTKFVAVPREGSWMKAESGRILRVCKVTHYMEDVNRWTNPLEDHRWEPRIEIEINKITGG